MIRKDGHGHEADSDGVAELESAGLATTTDTEIALTESGEAQLARLIEAMRAAAS